MDTRRLSWQGPPEGKNHETEAIVLHGYYSQTYRPWHHNFTEDFLFEPQLESGISESILAELREQDIRLIFALHDYAGVGEIQTYGFDGLGEPEGEGEGEGNPGGPTSCRPGPETQSKQSPGQGDVVLTLLMAFLLLTIGQRSYNKP